MWYILFECNVASYTDENALHTSSFSLIKVINYKYHIVIIGDFGTSVKNEVFNIKSSKRGEFLRVKIHLKFSFESHIYLHCIKASQKLHRPAYVINSMDLLFQTLYYCVTL